MNWFTRLFRKFSPTWFYPVGMNYDAWSKKLYAQYYNELPELNAVLNIKARAFANARLEGDQRLLSLLLTPNWYQSQYEFLYQSRLQLDIYGNQFTYILRPFGLNSLDSIRALYVLPSDKVKINQDDKLFFLTDQPVVTFEYVEGSRRVELQKENIIHFTSERLAGQVEGVSPINSLLPVLNNLKVAYQSRGVLLKYRGALGILTNEARDGIGNPFPIDQKERDRIQDEYRRYGLGEDQYQIIFSNQPLRFIPMTVSPDRLGLFDEAREALNKILDKYGVPADLMTRQQGSTYENQRQAERGFYLRTIIPEMAEWVQGINTTFDTQITASYTHLPFFQDDIKIKNEMLNLRINMLSKMYSDGAITLEEYRAEAIKILDK